MSRGFDFRLEVEVVPVGGRGELSGQVSLPFDETYQIERDRAAEADPFFQQYFEKAEAWRHD